MENDVMNGASQIQSELLPILLLIISLLSCKKDSYVVEKWQNGEVKTELIEGVDRFLMKEYYQNGIIKSAGFVNQDTVTKNGRWVYKSERGQIVNIINYIDGNIWGEFKEYHPSGALAIAGIYDEFGKQTGDWSTYYADSTMESNGRFQGGRKIGQWLYYHDNGTLSMKEEYSIEGDELIETIRFDEYGVIHNIREYTNGRLIRELMTAQDTSLGSKEVWYYPNGNKKMEGYKRGNHYVGRWDFWYSSGSKYAEGEFVENPRSYNGYVWQSYYPIEGLPINYDLDGIRIGTWRYWRESGEDLGYCKFRAHDRSKAITCSCRIKE